MSSSGIVPDLGLKTSSFWADIKQHLTRLNLTLDPREKQAAAKHLKSLNTLTALTSLKLDYFNPFFHTDTADLWVEPHPCHETLEEKLTLQLPNLVELLWCIQPLQKELILSCPKVTKVIFMGFDSVRMKVEKAALEELVIASCDQIQFTLLSMQDQLQNLWSLEVNRCSEVGRHLLQDVDQMSNLQKLEYKGFPAACMPTRYPKGLQEIWLRPLDWSQDLPRGLKGLCNLKSFVFQSESKFWDNGMLSNIKRPYTDFLPVDSLERLHLGFNGYERQPDGSFKSLQKSHEQHFAACGLRLPVAPNAEDKEGGQELVGLEHSKQLENL